MTRTTRINGNLIFLSLEDTPGKYRKVDHNENKKTATTTTAPPPPKKKKKKKRNESSNLFFFPVLSPRSTPPCSLYLLGAYFCFPRATVMITAVIYPSSWTLLIRPRILPTRSPLFELSTRIGVAKPTSALRPSPMVQIRTSGTSMSTGQPIISPRLSLTGASTLSLVLRISTTPPEDTWTQTLGQLPFGCIFGSHADQPILAMIHAVKEDTSV